MKKYNKFLDYPKPELEEIDLKTLLLVKGWGLSMFTVTGGLVGIHLINEDGETMHTINDGSACGTYGCGEYVDQAVQNLVDNISEETISFFGGFYRDDIPKIKLPKLTF